MPAKNRRPRRRLSDLRADDTPRGEETQARLAESPAIPAVPSPADDELRPTALLVGCVSRKEASARPAKDLYRTELFRRRRAYAEATGHPWLIISALHGVVEPDAVIEPYDVRLTDLSALERGALGERIAAELHDRFGALRDRLFEVHAGDEYFALLTTALTPHGAALRRPLRGLRIGEQLAWYGGRTSPLPSEPPPTASRQATSTEAATEYTALAREITTEFVAGHLDLSARPNAPTVGWTGMPEVAVAERLRAAGADDAAVRLVLTFTAAMDRARDADRLWFRSAALYETTPWPFDPNAVTSRQLTELTDVLRTFGVSQRHGADAAAWRTIAESMSQRGAAPQAYDAVFEGKGDARELLGALQATTDAGSDRFPFLRGPKIGPMWVRMLAHPGRAAITSLEVLPVAVDVQVRKVSEYLGVTATEGLDLEAARPVIQRAWESDVRQHGAVGPPHLDGTAAALDPALWFYGKWGCTFCERAARKLPISSVCARCRFPEAGARSSSFSTR